MMTGYLGDAFRSQNKLHSLFARQWLPTNSYIPIVARRGMYALEPQISGAQTTQQPQVLWPWSLRASLWGLPVTQKNADRPWVPTPSPRSRDRGRRSPDRRAAHGGERWYRQGLQCRDDGARALRAVFSSHDNWLNLSEAERDEWRGYFDRMLEWLHHLGYTPERNPWSMLLKGLTTGAGSSDEGAS